MASFGIGAKLRQERVGRGLTIDDVARVTRISPRYLEAIEADHFDKLPGLVFVRNFVRQFAMSLNLDPEPLMAELPRLDEAKVQLPNPPARPRSSFRNERKIPSGVWLVLAAAAAIGAWIHFNHSQPMHAANSSPPPARQAVTAPAVTVGVTPMPLPAPVQTSAVQVVITAHQPAWVQVSVDGRNTFTGVLQPDETKEISAAEQVRLVAGNAGALTVSLNGKTLEPLGSAGQVRVIRLTAEGPEFLARDPQPAPDPL